MHVRMNEKKIEEINKHITLTSSQLYAMKKSLLEQPDKLASILLDECQAEIERVQKILAESETFESRLKERCSKRSHDFKKSIPMRCLLDTPANRFYWHLTQLVFKPTNMQSMLHIMLPDVKYQAELSPYPATEVHDNNKTEPGPLRLELAPLAMKESAPNFDELENFTISIDTIVDKRKLAKLTQIQQSDLRNHLAVTMPNMLNAITMQDGMVELQNLLRKGPQIRTPRDAIQQFVDSCNMVKVSARQFTPKEFALDILRFTDFMESLQETTRNNLRALSNHDSTLGKVIDNHINKGDCVQNIRKQLSDILNANHKPHAVLDPLLNVQLAENDRNMGINDRQSTHAIVIGCKLPDLLANSLFKNSNTEVSQLSHILLRTPVCFYQQVIQLYGWLDQDYALKLIEGENFNKAQTRALVHVLFYTCKQYGASFCDKIDKAVIHSENLYFVETVLENYNETQCEDIVCKYNYHNLWSMSTAKLCLFLDKIPDEYRRHQIICKYLGALDLSQIISDSHHKLISYITNDSLIFNNNLENAKSYNAHIINACAQINLERAMRMAKAARQVYKINKFSFDTCNWMRLINNLEVLKAALPDDVNETKLIEFLMTNNKHTGNILDISKSAEIISYVLGHIPKQDRYRELASSRHAGIPPLFRSDLGDEVLKVMILSIPVKIRLDAIALTRGNGDKSLLAKYNQQPTLATFLLEAIPAHKRLKAALEVNSDRHEFLSNAMFRAANTQNPNYLRAFLTVIPPNDRLAALKGNGKIGTGECAIKPVSKNTECMLVIQKLLTERELQEFLQIARTPNAIVASDLIDNEPRNEESITIFFRSMSTASLTTILTTPIGNHLYLISRLVERYPTLIPGILERVAEDSRLFIIKKGIMEISKLDANLLKATLALISNVSNQLSILQRLLQYCAVNSAALTKVLSNIPENLRYTSLRAQFVDDPQLPKWFASQLSTLELISAPSINSVLYALPDDHRFSLLTAMLPNGNSIVLTKLLSHDRISSYAKCLAPLSEEQSFNLLQTRHNNRKFIHCFADQVNLFHHTNFQSWFDSQNDKQNVGRTFLFDYINIYAFFVYENKYLRKHEECLFSMFCYNEAGKLLAQLDNCKTVTELKLTLAAYLQNPASKYRADIVKTLTGATYYNSDAQNKLEKDWGMDKIKRQHDLLHSHNLIRG